MEQQNVHVLPVASQAQSTQQSRHSCRPLLYPLLSTFSTPLLFSIQAIGKKEPPLKLNTRGNNLNLPGKIEVRSCSLKLLWSYRMSSLPCIELCSDCNNMCIFNTPMPYIYRCRHRCSMHGRSKFTTVHWPSKPFENSSMHLSTLDSPLSAVSVQTLDCPDPDALPDCFNTV